jgi:LacI family transcriptional regulator
VAVVLIDSDLSYPERSALDLAGMDNFRAGLALAGHLLGLGCRSPVFVHRPRSATTTHARADGFRAALAARGISPAGRVLEAEPDDARLAKKLLSGLRADGIVCGNDYTAALLMKNLLAAGARIPERVKITGVDDLKYARLLGIPLTTLAQPCREIGMAALELMRFRLENPAAAARQILPDFKIIIRESTVKNAGGQPPAQQEVMSLPQKASAT